MSHQFSSDVHENLSKAFYPTEIIAASIIGLFVGLWISTLVYIGIRLAVNAERLKPPLLTYRMIPMPQSIAKTPEAENSKSNPIIVLKNVP
uniref:Uncharacterized protein n=2 Tax=Panagrolaimus sp. JU765 TaxID=591449 RepID=A0AC34RHZ1_9BILA